jgi:hypothetical protein
LAAVDGSIEEDRGRNMMTIIRAATAIVIRIMAPLLFGRDCAWCVKSSVEVIGCSPVADLRTQIERAALRHYFSLGKKGYDCKGAAKHPAKTTRHTMNFTYKFAEMTPEKRPQDPSLDGTGLIFETLKHGGESFRSVSPDSPLHASSLGRTNNGSYRFGLLFVWPWTRLYSLFALRPMHAAIFRAAGIGGTSAPFSGKRAWSGCYRDATSDMGQNAEYSTGVDDFRIA